MEIQGSPKEFWRSKDRVISYPAMWTKYHVLTISQNWMSRPLLAQPKCLKSMETFLWSFVADRSAGFQIVRSSVNTVSRFVCMLGKKLIETCNKIYLDLIKLLNILMNRALWNVPAVLVANIAWNKWLEDQEVCMFFRCFLRWNGKSKANIAKVSFE